MVPTQRFLGAKTAFGTVVAVEQRLFNPLCTVRSRDGSETQKPLALLFALGLELKNGATA